MTTLQQLKANIYIQLPDLMELGAGCELIIFDKKYTLIKKDYNHFYLLSEYKREIVFNNPTNYEILGRPITLPDVIQYLRLIYPINHDFWAQRFKVLELWDMEKYTIDEQSVELIEFLFNLTPTKKK